MCIYTRVCVSVCVTLVTIVGKLACEKIVAVEVSVCLCVRVCVCKLTQPQFFRKPFYPLFPINKIMIA